MKIEITVNNEKFIFEGDDAIVRAAVQQFIAAKVPAYQTNIPWGPLVTPFSQPLGSSTIYTGELHRD